MSRFQVFPPERRALTATRDQKLIDFAPQNRFPLTGPPGPCYHRIEHQTMALDGIQELNLRHREIIRFAFAGMESTRIAEQVGLTPETVRAILRSPLAQAEIARLSDLADDAATNVPMKVRLVNELSRAGESALRINTALMEDPGVDPRVRAGIGRHFLDRVVFGREDDSREGGYRDILRSLDRIEKKVDGDIIEARASASDLVDGPSPDQIGFPNGDGNGSSPH